MTTATEPARRGRPGYDRDSMLEVVVEVFNERGYDAASLGSIADKLGLSKSAIYHHFASKEQMLEVALGRALDALEAVFESPGATTGPVVSRIRHVVRGAVLVLCEEMPFVTLLLRLRGNTPIELEAMRRRREFDRKLRALFELSRDEGTLRADMDPRIAERLTFGMVNSIVEWYRPDGTITPEQLADSVLELVRTGLHDPASL
ncbi:TetR/AcrR family transcriptional regulator [Agrococcus sp. Marseille-Q4369]|uniref:TetR/AcrR family transcriptional regulator n=1 Tax=Agrococcus sp. Marseille-Q4369 TaxID=2810513 RepID=UPI001B8B905D|nr:TetR/AcrR family transcriptional regulator [Agrococcus sp. Marseille-Q4369]QUW18128.1 TetR family transcriptional regulator [Agrococcus sp. Marseille-Q4369]